MLYDEYLVNKYSSISSEGKLIEKKKKIKISNKAIEDLLNKMIEEEQEKRISIGNLLQNPLFKKFDKL